jgi:hypothetical protein
LAGAELIDQLQTWLKEAGFEKIEIRVRQNSREFIEADAIQGKLDEYVASADVLAVKPVH